MIEAQRRQAVKSSREERFSQFKAHAFAVVFMVQAWGLATVPLVLAEILRPKQLRGRRFARPTSDAGEALAWAVMAVGGVLLAGIVYAALRGKSQAIVNNVCTNADPSSC